MKTNKKKTNKNVSVRVFLLLALFTFNCSLLPSAHAEYALPYLAFETTDGETLSLAVEGLTIALPTGEGGTNGSTLVATDSEGAAYTFALGNLSKMYFTDEATGIQPLAPTSQEAVEAITISGITVGTFANAAAARRALPRGTYVLKSKSATFKISLP